MLCPKLHISATLAEAEALCQDYNQFTMAALSEHITRDLGQAARPCPNTEERARLHACPPIAFARGVVSMSIALHAQRLPHQKLPSGPGHLSEGPGRLLRLPDQPRQRGSLPGRERPEGDPSRALARLAFRRDGAC
ncbi:hypothetical protein DFAR_2050006 [Desulfarculales bacterium]